MEILRTVGTTVLDHVILISAGVVMVTFFLQRWSDQTEGQVNAALAWLEGALQQAPDRLNEKPDCSPYGLGVPPQ